MPTKKAKSPKKKTKPSSKSTHKSAAKRPVMAAAKPAPKKHIRVLIADDDPLVRSAVRLMLAPPKYEIVAEAVNGDEAARKAREFKPDILLLDLAMPGKAGMDALRDLGNSIPGLKTVVLTVAIAKRQIVEALQLGARGIALKESASEVLLPCIETVLTGRYWVNRAPVQDVYKIIQELQALPELNRPSKRDLLNPKELQIVGFIVEGRTNKDIASTLNTSEQVIKNHLGKIFDKLGVFNRLELALYALDNQMVERAV